MTRMFLIAIALLVVLADHSAFAQRNKPNPTPSSFCTRDSALDTIQQQIDVSKTFDDTVKRIAVLIRGADLIWPYRQDKARGALTEAFDLAIRNFKENGDQTVREGRMPVQLPDQRYVVITAIAKRDAAWARKLADQILEEESRDAEDKNTRDPQQERKNGERLLNVAFNLLGSDQGSALAFARKSLRYPATIQVPGFLYRLAELNKGAADQFYQEALTAYANAPMDQFLYLSSYPFGRNREVGEMPVWTYYKVPDGFLPSPSLQRVFIQTLLRRAQEVVENPSAPIPGNRFSETEQIWMALNRLESQVQLSLTELVTPLQQAKANISAQLSQKDQQRTSQTLTDPPRRSFDELVEAAERQADLGRRDGGLALAVLSGSDAEENLDHVVAAADKISDSDVREQVLSRLYFNRTQLMLKENKLDAARKLAAKVVEVDQRAYLYSQIATESIKQTKNDVEAREMLEEVVVAVAKAPDTEVKVRALLGVAYLYAKVDPNRAVSVLGEAVKSINKIESPDFSRDYVSKRIEGKAFGYYTILRTPGFNPENAFKEMGKLDFDGTLYQAGNFTHKFLRAMTTLALVEPCLQQQPPKSEKPKPKGKP
jgi:hypothetical protein